MQTISMWGGFRVEPNSGNLDNLGTREDNVPLSDGVLT